jgi:hypothetical protein
MSVDTLAMMAFSLLCAMAGAAAAAITLVSSVKTDVEWLKSRLVDISRKLERIEHRPRDHT